MQRRTSRLILSVFLIFSIFGVRCTGSINPVLPSEFQGIWRSDGYGSIVEIEGTQVTIYDETSVSLIRSVQATLNGDNFIVDISTPIGVFNIPFTLSLSGTELTMRSDQPYTVLTFSRIQSLPDVTSETKDPETNFEIFWQTFEEQYAFFGLRNVDWQTQYQTSGPQVGPNTTDTELFDILSGLVQPLEDGHIYVCSDSGCFNPGIPHPFEDKAEQMVEIILEEYLNGNFSFEANGQLIYGKLTPEIGYVNILAMAGFTRDASFAQWQSALESGLDKILQEFQDLDALVIDVRFNPGGFDDFSLVIASRLADQKRLAFSTQARNGGYQDFTPHQEFFVAPEGVRQFTKKIVLLTSGMTASAAEVFTLSMMPFPYVTRVGEPTKGMLSDILERRLPNGWTFGLTNERYLSFEMASYESVGVPPDIEIFMSEEDLAANRDSILDAALEFFASQDSVSAAH